ncbi:sensor histidine kinase [Demequina soli]|uniref:sensor histidine kinase n=1 Tax=Demequina soli TaxID=1638987 RepID=UPI00078031CD|nr:histidine kinase [Demequina soli]
MGTMRGRVPRPATERGRDALGGGVLAAALAVLVLVEDGVGGLAAVGTLAALAACAALAWRRARPVPVLAVVLALFAASAFAALDTPLAFVPLVVALYTAASRVARIPVALAIGAGTAGVVGAAVAVGTAREATDSVTVSAEVWMALVTAVGVATNLYRRTVAQERARALQAEETREAVARTRVAEERLRIARELHDAVGHHVAVMNVQAGVAEALLGTRPDEAAEALGRVQDAGARVLEELPVMLRVLRQGEEDDTRPAVGLAALDALITQARDAGLAVELRRAEAPADLPAATDQAAYRIVQEALSNARRYGTGAATVSISAAGSDLAVEVRNAVSGAAGLGSGFGLVGMRERADAAGGGVSAGPEGQEFVVRAALPLRRRTGT